MRIATLALLVFTVAGSQAALGASSCSIFDIEVRRMNWRIMGGSGLNADGELVNRCDEPIGIQIKVRARDSAGKVIYTEDTWPARFRDIPPKKPYPFKIAILDPGVKAAASVSVDVIKVKRWGQ